MEEFRPFDLFERPPVIPERENGDLHSTYSPPTGQCLSIRSLPLPKGFFVSLHREEFRRFTPALVLDGKWIAFKSDGSIGGHNFGRQLWVMAVNGGEARPLTRIKSGVSSFLWSSTEDRLAIVSPCDPAEGLVEAAEEGGGESDPEDMSALFAKYNADVRHITEIKYKFDGMGFLEGKRSHVEIISFSPDGELEPR